MVTTFWQIATLLVLGACVLVILGCAMAFVLAILGWDREEAVDARDWQAVEDERQRMRLKRVMGKP